VFTTVRRIGSCSGPQQSSPLLEHPVCFWLPNVSAKHSDGKHYPYTMSPSYLTFRDIVTPINIRRSQCAKILTQQLSHSCPVLGRFSSVTYNRFYHQSQPLFFNVNITSYYTLHVSAYMQAIIRCCKHKITRDGIVTPQSNMK
jgi:hypothetical protein